MKSLFKLSVNNPVLVHMITIVVIVLGSYTLIKMPCELERDMSFNWALIWVAYPGVSPEEIEKLIAKPIEDEIADVDRIESITSTAAEGFAGISVKFNQNISRNEFERLYQDLRTELDKVRDLPEDAKDPVMFKLESNTVTPVIDVVISGDLPEKRIQELAEALQDQIEIVEGVLEVSVYGIRNRQILGRGQSRTPRSVFTDVATNCGRVSSQEHERPCGGIEDWTVGILASHCR